MAGFMMTRLTGAALALAIIVWANVARADPLTQWLDGVASCVPTKVLSLAIVGVEPSQTALSREQAEEVRLFIENRLQATGRVRIAAAADVVRIKALREGTTGLSGAEAEEQIRKAFDGDASVFFVAPHRSAGSVSFRLQAIARSADCKVTSEPLEAAIRTGSGVADIDQVMRNAVRNLAQNAPDVKDIIVCPFAASAGHSTCAAALTDRLTIALDAEARSPSRLLAEKRLDVRRALVGACAAQPGGVTARGTFDHDRNGQSWMSVEFHRDGTILAPTGRTRITVDALGCDPTVRPFLDHVAATALVDRARVDAAASASPFAKGQRLDIRIEAKAKLRLYCWVLAPDQTGFVALPVRGDENRSAVPPGVFHYPRGFQLSEIVLNAAFENVFSCFAVEGQLPAALHERWLAAAPSAATEAKLLSRDDTLDLLEKIRATPGVSEAVTRIIVR
jgi:hypothetical protein